MKILKSSMGTFSPVSNCPLFLISAIILILICIIISNINVTPELSGKILVKVDSSYADIYDLSKKTFEGHRIEQFNAKILSNTPFVFYGYYDFYRYNTELKSATEYKANFRDNIKNLIPVSENSVYYLENDKIMKCELEPRKYELVISDAATSFDYNINSKDIYYKSGLSIYKYNEITQTTTPIVVSGGEPKISPDNSQLAYRSLSDKNKLIVQDTSTNKTKEIIVDTRVSSYCFSPDSKYIAILKPEGFRFFQKFKLESYEILLWDYCNDKKYILLNDLDKLYDIDWQ